MKDPSYVVDLTRPDEFSKGHRSAIKRQQATGEKIGFGKHIARFQCAHREAAGRVTRPEGTWMLMDSWLGVSGLLAATSPDGFLATRAWAYVVYEKPGAYYFSAAGKDSHNLQRYIIDMLRRNGFEWYELGAGHTPGIDTFKRGFSKLTVEP